MTPVDDICFPASVTPFEKQLVHEHHENSRFDANAICRQIYPTIQARIKSIFFIFLSILSDNSFKFKLFLSVFYFFWDKSVLTYYFCMLPTSTCTSSTKSPATKSTTWWPTTTATTSSFSRTDFPSWIKVIKHTEYSTCDNSSDNGYRESSYPKPHHESSWKSS